MIKFRSKFQFQLLFQFYRTAEKNYQNWTCDGNSQKLTNTAIFSTVTFWLLFCFFMIEIQGY